MKRLILLFSLCGVLLAQGATGIVTFTPPSAAHFVATGGTVSCTVAGNASPATSVSITCTLGSISIPTYVVPLPSGTSYTFSEGYNGDTVTIVLSSPGGVVTWQATATPNGGTAGSGNGTL